MKRRVLIVYAGGTIGMQPSDKGYIPMKGFHEHLSSFLRSRGLKDLPNFDIIECQELIDSSNLVPKDWTALCELLMQHWDEYDGFVLLHGTDTMAYTASMLSFLMQGLNKPIILTGSQIPMMEARSDAAENLISSVLVAGNLNIPEVCILFANRILRGNRSTKTKSSEFDAFDSPNFPWLGKIGITIDIQKRLLLDKRAPTFFAPTFDQSAVAVLHIYPGIATNILTAVLDQPDIKGLILKTYGAGNPPDANKSFIKALEQASENDIITLNITQCACGAVNQGTYSTGATLNSIGVIAGADLTLEAAFTKLHFLLSQSLPVDKIRHALRTPLAGEMTI
ncbi:MAG: L-asparaginase 1 [Oceanospirillales bacterium]|nr:MAG: L-asparaginase 1 [Oceanospirillales bacterium]